MDETGGYEQLAGGVATLFGAQDMSITPTFSYQLSSGFEVNKTGAITLDINEEV